MKIVQVHPGILPIPPNGWGAVEKIIWEYKLAFEKMGHVCDIKYLNDIIASEYDVIHVHMGNLAIECFQRNMQYYFTCHDHHAYIYGKDHYIFKQNFEAAKHSIKTFLPSKYLVKYFDLPNVEYLSHGVNNSFFRSTPKIINQHKLLCIANNGISHDNSYDRKGFGFAIKAAKSLNLPITVAGPLNNKNFFNTFNFEYDKLTILFDLTEEELLKQYQTHTIFLHLSDLEAGHPNLTLLEAMSCGLPTVATLEDDNELSGLIKSNRSVDVVVKDLNYVIDNYEKLSNDALKTAKEKSWDSIVKSLYKTYNQRVMGTQLINLYDTTKIKIVRNKEIKNKIRYDFDNTVKVSIDGQINKKYKVNFIDQSQNKSLFENVISNNMWCSTNYRYYINWKIEVTDLDTDQIVSTYQLNLKNQRVKIKNESPSLGDTIAWMAYVDLFQRKHNCILDFYTPHNNLFKSTYKNINFYNYNEINNNEYYASYSLGCFNVDNRFLSPKDYRSQNLQEIAANILGFSYKELKTNITVNNIDRPINEKYVCISTSSTSGCKHWQNENGWQQTVDYLNNLGFKVVVIQKEPLNYMDLKGLNNVIHPKTESLDDAISWLYHCEFYIGLSSGISWLSWALDKKVIMISGFTKKFNEFSTPHRIINNSVCNGCWNDNNHKFDGGDWNWCPRLKGTDRQFECTKTITFEYIKKEIDKIK